MRRCDSNVVLKSGSAVAVRYSSAHNAVQQCMLHNNSQFIVSCSSLSAVTAVLSVLLFSSTCYITTVRCTSLSAVTAVLSVLLYFPADLGNFGTSHVHELY